MSVDLGANPLACVREADEATDLSNSQTRKTRRWTCSMHSSMHNLAFAGGRMTCVAVGKRDSRSLCSGPAAFKVAPQLRGGVKGMWPQKRRPVPKRFQCTACSEALAKQLHMALPTNLQIPLTQQARSGPTRTKFLVFPNTSSHTQRFPVRRPTGGVAEEAKSPQSWPESVNVLQQPAFRGLTDSPLDLLVFCSFLGSFRPPVPFLVVFSRLAVPF